VLVAGGGGFIGHHLASELKASGDWVRVVDLHPPLFEPTKADEFLQLDLRDYTNCARATQDVDDVYQLAADMGGIGYITANHAELSRNNILINAHMLEAARKQRVQRYLFTSSACVYPSFKQDEVDVPPLREEDAIPADPEKGYGWEKLFSEQLTSYYREEFGIHTVSVRFHNIYGPLGTYEGGREKAPAALSRKVAAAEDHTSIEVWGDGQQTRSFCYIDDCVEGLRRLMASGHVDPINLGSEELVTVEELARIIVGISGKTLSFKMNPSRPQGVRARNSDNRRLRQVLGWEPQVSLREGLAITYRWIYDQLSRTGRSRPVLASSIPPGGMPHFVASTQAR
jgi:GDP-D-mannose 3', 5'-epimerase